jgi:hypothetical protein
MTNTTSIIGAEGTSPTKEDSSIQGSCINASVTELKYPMQKLWIEDAWWTRSYIVSNLAGLKDQNLIHMGDILTDGIVKQFPERFK